MTFNSRKVDVGQQIVTIASIELDRCKHTTEQSVIDGNIAASAGVTDVYTGVLAITGGTATSFSSSGPYILWDDEIIKVTVNSDIELDITGRGEFGTVAAAHSSGSVKLMHSGEADGSCYATPNTCSSADSYDADTKLIFNFPTTQLDLDQIFYNGFKSWSHTPAKVAPGESVGKRAGGSVRVADSKDTDVYVPYSDRRTTRGMLFDKLLERHPNFEGRPIKIKTGFDPLNYDEANFITREYIMDSVNLDGGVLNIKFLDPLILTEDKKAKAPIASQGTNTIKIDNTSTTITYTDAPAFDYGVATSTVFVRVDKEVIECTVLSDFVLTIVNRAIGGTEQKDHEINATIQECLVYDDVNVIDIIEDLLTNYTNINSSFLDDYTAVKAATSAITLTANINKPTAVIKLINELVITGDLVMFYSETEQKIKINQVKDASAGIISINEDDHIEKDSISVSRDVKGQYTRYTVAWSPNDITQTKDEENFSIVYQSVNLNQELPKAKGEVNEKKTFFNRWLTNSNDDVLIGAGIAQSTIDRTDKTPINLSYILDVESVFDTQSSMLDLGTIYSLSTSRGVNVDGSQKSQTHQVLSMKDLGNMKYKIESRLFQDPVEGITVDFTINTNKENYDLSTEFAPAAGHYTILIDSGVTIGSTSVSIPAFTTGAQAAGVSFEIIVRGSILSIGGVGGSGGGLLMPEVVDTAGSFSQVGTVGLVGGNAFNATVNCVISVGGGAIWAGGGGAAGEKSVGTNNVSPILANAGNGGCGGQGYAIAFGGVAGFVSMASQGTLDTGETGVNGVIGSQGIQGSNEGGTWGESGSDESTVSGGLPGYAIISNGNSVTFTSGDNAINIKGRRS